MSGASIIFFSWRTFLRITSFYDLNLVVRQSLNVRLSRKVDARDSGRVNHGERCLVYHELILFCLWEIPCESSVLYRVILLEDWNLQTVIACHCGLETTAKKFITHRSPFFCLLRLSLFLFKLLNLFNRIHKIWIFNWLFSYVSLIF